MDSEPLAAQPASPTMRRRQALFDAERAYAAGELGAPDERWGLCLSGGGIRSATFSLGVIQAIARAPARSNAAPQDEEDPAGQPDASPLRHADTLFARFDYLSTVSGGGYVGSFVSSMFVPGRLSPMPRDAASPSPVEREAAADLAIAALSQDPPGRIFSGANEQQRDAVGFPLAWLRDNGRYLSPTGAGDMAYAGALDLRNWLAIHYVVGTVLVVLFSLLALLRALLPPDWGLDALPEPGSVIWPSPLLWIALLPLALGGVPLGLAFWFTYPSRSTTPRALNWAVAWVCVLDVLFVALLIADGADASWQWHPRMGLLLFGVVALSASLVWFALLRQSCDKANQVASMRVLATRWLLGSLQCMLVLLALGLVETVGQSLYLVSLAPHAALSVWSASSLAAILAWIAKALMKRTSPAQMPGWLKHVPMTTLGGLVGVLIFALLACAWSYFVTWVVWDGQWPVEAGRSVWLRAIICAMALMLAWVTGQFPGFINLSSLQSFYSARLTRAYLGASNGKRVAAIDAQDPKLSAAEPAPGDDLQLADFYSTDAGAARTLAPFHIINTTLNKTVDPSQQLVQRDRKGQSFAVSPIGFLVDGRFNGFRYAEGQPEICKTLSVGGWVGISGAAASTGIGRNTSLGLSLLLGASNVRLGSWWESQADGPQASESPVRRAFRTQSYLFDEFTAKFHGLARRWQYLTDGGHFENLGLYELLRPERRLQFAIAVDAGADPDYQFGDLANLIRLVRIDFRVEVEVLRETFPPALARVFGTPEDFRSAGQGAAPGPVTQCAVLLKVDYPDRADCAWVVLIKPRVLSDAAADVREYALTHPSFPQQSTGDQFFDEAQWESYRKLGLSNAEAVLEPHVRSALQSLTGVDLAGI